MNRLHILVRPTNHPSIGVLHLFNLADAPPPAGYPNKDKNINVSAIDPADLQIVQFRANSNRPLLVRNAGDHVTIELKQNPEIDRALAYATNQASTGGLKIPVFFELCDWAEEFPWEAMFETHDFLANRPENQIGRLVEDSILVDRMLDGSDVTRRPVFRLLAILATGDQSADDREWHELYQAKQVADASGKFEMDLDVLVCDPNLLKTIDKSFNAPSGLNSRVELIQDKNSILRAIDRRPHAIHFFCHGVGSTNGSPGRLALATKGSVIGTSKKPIEVNAKWLRDEIEKNAPNHVWQIVLNCCSGAKGGLGGRSIAKELVGSNVPVVIGMSEPIDRNSAHVFTNAYYLELIRKIRNLIPLSFGSVASVEWVDALHSPRRDLLEDASSQPACTATASDYKIWTLPVLYTLPQAFRFGVTGLGATDQVASNTTIVIGAELREIPGLPSTLANELQAEADANRLSNEANKVVYG